MAKQDAFVTGAKTGAGTVVGTTIGVLIFKPLMEWGWGKITSLFSDDDEDDEDDNEDKDDKED